jgi:hypothetical protein
MNDGQGKGFFTIANTLQSSAIVSKNPADAGFEYALVRGAIYQFRFRVQNINGWSEYSPALSVYAANIPKAPEPVTVLSSSGTQITV